jgi:hypothetical protein
MGGAGSASPDAALPPGTTVAPALPANNNSSDARTRDAARTRDRDVR